MVAQGGGFAEPWVRAANYALRPTRRVGRRIYHVDHFPGFRKAFTRGYHRSPLRGCKTLLPHWSPLGGCKTLCRIGRRYAAARFLLLQVNVGALFAGRNDVQLAVAVDVGNRELRADAGVVVDLVGREADGAVAGFLGPKPE